MFSIAKQVNEIGLAMIIIVDEDLFKAQVACMPHTLGYFKSARSYLAIYSLLSYTDSGKPLL